MCVCVCVCVDIPPTCPLHAVLSSLYSQGSKEAPEGFCQHSATHTLA